MTINNTHRQTYGQTDRDDFSTREYGKREKIKAHACMHQYRIVPLCMRLFSVRVALLSSLSLCVCVSEHVSPYLHASMWLRWRVCACVFMLFALVRPLALSFDELCQCMRLFICSLLNIWIEILTKVNSTMLHICSYSLGINVWFCSLTLFCLFCLDLIRTCVYCTLDTLEKVLTATTITLPKWIVAVCFDIGWPINARWMFSYPCVCGARQAIPLLNSIGFRLHATTQTQQQ